MESSARQRLLETAARIFYTRGIHAVSVDEVIVEAEVSRATFYRYFPGREDLVLAYLEREDQQIREMVAAGAQRAAEPRELLELLVLGLGEQICGRGFRGCPFINAAAEYPDADHPIRQLVQAHRTWFRQAIADVLAGAGHPEPDDGAQSLVMLRDGAMVGGYLEDPLVVRAGLIRAAKQVMTR